MKVGTSVARTIAAAHKAGLRVIGIRPDGTLIVHDGKEDISSVIAGALGAQYEDPEVSRWTDLQV